MYIILSLFIGLYFGTVPSHDMFCYSRIIYKSTGAGVVMIIW